VTNTDGKNKRTSLELFINDVAPPSYDPGRGPEPLPIGPALSCEYEA
jgi:hypothetical protein